MDNNLFDFTSSGGTGPMSSPADSFSAGMKDLFSFDKINQNASSGPTFGNRESMDMLSAQKDYNPYAFNPSDSVNFERLADKETMGSALMKGLDSFAYKFGNTFVDYWKDYGRMANALVNMDWSKMMPDQETMLQQYYRDQMDMQKNHVFVDPEDEDGIFNKRFLSEFVGNAGFALGTFAGLSVELAADALLTGLSGGAGSGLFAATAARLGMKSAAKTGAKAAARSGGYMIDDVLKGFVKGGASSVDEIAAASAKKMEDIGTIAGRTRSATENVVGNTFGIFSRMFDITKAKSMGDFGEKVLAATPILGTGVDMGKKIAAGSKAGLNGGELFGMGLQGVRRMAQELNMSSTEASFEAVSTYGDSLHEMISEFESREGRPPAKHELEDMESLALKAASGNYNTNMAILMATNKIQFGNMFNKYRPSNRFMRDMMETADPSTLTVSTKALTQVYQKGKFGTMGLLGKISKDFGKKEMAYQMTKSVLKNTAKFELSEGIQENLQETSAAGWKDYYMAKHIGAELALSDAFELGLRDQFTKQGFKTFLMGAMTGMIVSGPTRLINTGIQGLNEKMVDLNHKGEGPSPRQKYKTEFQRGLDELNASLKEISTGKFKDKVFNFAAQVNAAVAQTEAAGKNLEYEFQNAKDDAFVSAVISAKKTGSVKALVQAVRNMGTEMTADEFQASFGMDLADTKYKSASEFAESIAGKIEKFSEDIDNIRNSVGKMIDPMMYEEKSRGRYVASLMRQTQEDAIEIIAFDMLKGNLSAERAKQLAGEIRGVEGLSNSTDFAIRTLSEGRFVEAEVGNTVAEVKQLERQLKEVTDATLKKDLNKRKKMLETRAKLLQDWLGYFEGKEDVVTNEETGQKSSRGMQYGRFVGESIKETVVEDEVDQETGEVKQTKKTKEVFDPKAKKAKETFRKLVNLMNEEAGTTAQISEKALQESFDKYVDYLQLDQDVRDYMSGVEALSDPDNMIRTLERMVDGNFKFRVQWILENMDRHRDSAIGSMAWDLFQRGDVDSAVQMQKEAHQIYTQIPEFKELIDMMSDPKLSFRNIDKAFELVNKVGEEFSKRIVGLAAKYQLKDYKNEMGDAEYQNFKLNGVVDEGRINEIAEDLLELPEDGTPESVLHPRELEVYNAKKAEIDQVVANLKTARANKAPDPVVNNPIPDPHGKPVKADDPSGPVSDQKKVAHELTLSFKLKGGFTARWNPKRKSFVFFNKAGKQATQHRQIKRLSEELENMPGMAKVFWNDLLGSEDRAYLFDQLMKLGEIAERLQYQEMDIELLREYTIMNALYGVKFHESLLRDMTDIKKSAWIDSNPGKGEHIDTFARDVVADLLAGEGLISTEYFDDSTLDTDALIEEIKDVIRKYDRGITKKNLREVHELALGSTEYDQQVDSIISSYGIAPNTLLSILADYLADPQRFQTDEQARQQAQQQPVANNPGPETGSQKNSENISTDQGQNPTAGSGGVVNNPVVDAFDISTHSTAVLQSLLPAGELPTSGTILELATAIKEMHEDHTFDNQFNPLTLEEFVKGAGKAAIAEKAKEILTAGKPTAAKAPDPVIAVTAGRKAPTTMAEIPGSFVVAMEDLERLNRELVEIEQQALQIPANLRNFVEEDTPSETQALNYLNDLLSCGK